LPLDPALVTEARSLVESEMLTDSCRIFRSNTSGTSDSRGGLAGGRTAQFTEDANPWACRALDRGGSGETEFAGFVLTSNTDILLAVQNHL